MLEISPEISSENTPNIVEESFKELKNLVHNQIEKITKNREYKPDWEKKSGRNQINAEFFYFLFLFIFIYEWSTKNHSKLRPRV